MADDAQVVYPTPMSATSRPANRLIRRLVASIVIASGVLVADQLTKWLAQTYLTRAPDQSVPIIDDLIRLTYVANRGAAFGILQNQTVVFVVIGVGILAFHLMRTPERGRADTRGRPYGSITQDAESR